MGTSIMKSLITTLLLSVLGLGINCGAFAAKYYKWTDDSGVTHYGAIAPHGKESQAIDVRTGESRSAATDKSAPRDSKPPTSAAKPPTSTEPADSGETEPARQEDERAQQEQRNKNCELARENAEILRTRARVRVNDPDTGELRYLSPDEKKAREEATAKSIEENCD